MKFIKTPVKGMCDMLPSDMRLREELLQTIRSSYASYGFMQIETPVMEHIENLTSKQGGDNEKLIFKVMKRGAELARAIEKGEDFADNGLRYDLTVPLSRYYSNNKEQLPVPFKALQMGNVWRADNPQKGRFRQFMQCDIDILGDETNLAEIELIGATSTVLSKILAGTDITGLTVNVNDRRLLFAAARYAGFSEEDIPQILISLDKADKIGFEGIRKELTEAGYCADIVDKYLGIYENCDQGISLDDFCEKIGSDDGGACESLKQIMSCAAPLVPATVSLKFNPSLVRGMGYYTGTIFEVSVDGYNFAIAGGGRYDKMIGKFIGTDVAAAGFSIGFERIVTILKDFGRTGDDGRRRIAFLLDRRLDEDRLRAAFEKAQALRNEGAQVSVLPMKKNLKRQVELLEEQGYTEFEKIYAD